MVIASIDGPVMMVAAAAWVDAMGMSAPSMSCSTTGVFARLRVSGIQIGSDKWTASANRDSATVNISRFIFMPDRRTDEAVTIPASEIKAFLGVE